MSKVEPNAIALDQLQDRLGYRFINGLILEQALRHRSSLPDRKTVSDHPPTSNPIASDWHNERLEFLGDAILNLAVSLMLYQAFPQATEGALSQWRASLVNTHSLSAIGHDLDLGKVLQLGRGEALSGGREKSSILAGTLEAVLGAAYLDGGELAANDIVDKLFRHMLVEIEPDQPGKDYKSMLQEMLQANGQVLPVYRVVSVSGLPHKRVFSVECTAEGVAPGNGTGSSKRAAEQEAARVVVANLDQREVS